MAFVWAYVCFLAIRSVPADEQLGDRQQDEDFFRSKIEPLLKSKCLGCHSHAAATMEGGLTLDSRSGWETGGDRGPAIVPGDPNRSLLVQAIRYDDPDLQMPPEGKLSAADTATLTEWVRRGAADPRREVTVPPPNINWWSLTPLVAPAVPGGGHPIDAFIGQRLQKQQIPPAPAAPEVTLVRRAYIDVLGWQPTPEEVARVLQDDREGAFERLVDRLLESPHYGERWARHWLDTIHFADSHGCEHDVKRPHAWRFRDYVIERLNADVAWDRFIREQLAPDVFFPRQPQLMAGLGFVAAGPLELSRAGTAPITFDYLDRDDIVTQTMAAFTSTTANCARCHTHKFDPITQEDYYALQAVFAGVGKGDIEFDESATVLRRRQKLAELLAAAQKGDSPLLLQPEYQPVVEQWIASRQSQNVTWAPLEPDVFLSSGGATLTRLQDKSVLASGTVPDEELTTVVADVGLKRVSAVRLDVLRDERLPMNGPGRADNGNLHLSEVKLQWFGAGADTAVDLNVLQASADFDQDGWTSAQAVDGDRKTGWAIYPRVNESHHIVFELDKPLDTSGGGRLAVTLEQRYPPKHVIGRFRLSVTDAARGAAQVLPATVREALSKPAAQRTEAESTAIAAVVLKPYAQQELASLPPKQIVYGVSSMWSHAKQLDAPQPIKTVHLLRRGAFDRPVREVGPGALSALRHLPPRFQCSDGHSESARRAALADWIAHRDNPLTWRSIVNRVWQYHFGRGLSDTPNDFGRMGSPPSHPELLDWLAVWFRDEARGSLKKLHRLILTSKTWRRSSRFGGLHDRLTKEAPAAADRENRLLWRSNRRRLDADVFRDSVLRISGRLDPAMGGPGVEHFVKKKGPQATPTLDYSAFNWESPEACRRSIYRVVWRGIPDPFMETLDFPDLSLLAPRRGVSVSALQSLALLNNDFVLHASEWMAERLQKEQADVPAQVAAATELVWLRSPEPLEQSLFVSYVQQHGLAAFCRLLFNSNEFLFVD